MKNVEKININDLKQELIESEIVEPLEIESNKACLNCILWHMCHKCISYEYCCSMGLNHLMADDYKIVDDNGDEINPLY